MLRVRSEGLEQEDRAQSIWDAEQLNIGFDLDEYHVETLDKMILPLKEGFKNEKTDQLIVKELMDPSINEIGIGKGAVSFSHL